MARSTQAWLDEDNPSVRVVERRSASVSTVFAKVWHGFSAGSRAAEVANALRAARCEDANEPQIANNAQAPAAFESATPPSFVTSQHALAADRHAPSWHPEIAAASQRPRGVAALLQIMVAAFRDLTNRNTQNRRATGRYTAAAHATSLRDPYLAPPSAENENPDTADLVIPPYRKRAAR